MFATLLLTVSLAAPMAGVPMKTIEAINRTITIDDWYAGQKVYTEEFLATYIQAADRDLIARSGFRAVKVKVDTEAMADGGASLIRSLETLLQPTASDVRLYVILDFQSAPPEAVVHYLRRDRVLVQLSRFGTAPLWRNACPQLTLIKRGGESKVETFVPDPNVVYSFEVYGSSIFQSQYNEKWDTNWGKLMYPPDPGPLRLTASKLSDPVKASLLSYVREEVGIGVWREQMKSHRDWGIKKRRYIWLDDVGCSALADGTSRNRYLSDFGSAANSLDIGWNLTSYTGLRSLTKGSPGNRTMRPEASAIFTSGG